MQEQVPTRKDENEESALRSLCLSSAIVESITTTSAAGTNRRSLGDGISGSSNWFVHMYLSTQQLFLLKTKHRQTCFPSIARAEKHTAASKRAALLSFRRTYFLWKACEHGHTPSSSLLQNSSKHTAHVCWGENMKPAVNLDRYTYFTAPPLGEICPGSARTDYYAQKMKTTVILLK